MSGPSKPRASFEFTDACAPFVPRVLTVSGLIALAALLLIHSGSAARVQAAPSRSYASASGLRIIFGLKDRMTGKSWNGSVVDRHKCGPVREVDLGRNRIIWSRRPDAGTDPRRVEFTFRDTQQFGGDFADASMAPTSEITSWSHPETGIRDRPAGTSRYYLRAGDSELQHGKTGLGGGNRMVVADFRTAEVRFPGCGLPDLV